MSNRSQEKRRFVDITESTSDIFMTIDLFEGSDSGLWAHREWSNKIIHDNRHFNFSMVNGRSSKLYWWWRYYRVLQGTPGL